MAEEPSCSEQAAAAVAPATASHIARGLHVVLRDNEGAQKVFRVAGKKDLYMGRYPPVPLDLFDGLPYGATLRFNDGKWSRQRPFNFEELACFGDDGDDAEVVETNQHLAQDNSAQSLRPEEINELKKNCSGEAVVAAIASSSATFASKTKFSQEKYIKKKQQKHVKQLTCLRPSLMELCETYLKTSRAKVCGLRFDYLSSALTHADVHAGGRYMVLDSALGLVTGAMARQLGGLGRIFRVFSGGCSDKALTELDLGERRNVVRQIPVDVLEHSDPYGHEWTSPSTRADGGDRAEASSGADAAAFAARQEARAQRARERGEMVKDFLEGPKLDAVLLFAQEEERALQARCHELGLRRLAPGGRLLVFGHYMQPLAHMQGEMKAGGDWVNVKLFQLFTREYQVLPQRTHPHMAQDVNHCEGFLLVGTRVQHSPSDEANSGGAADQGPAKRARTEPAAGPAA
eukprot:TRINITY_DN21270_c1_g6_i1.p1 TRINITY_DN21270_c1_g6~~TRINITY_DN21270_c1_g6_i1.p1  ORF type:complete len:460 (-),score=96.62 TRINITY_DN21270_c1_g6_i1:104-1483(-)